GGWWWGGQLERFVSRDRGPGPANGGDHRGAVPGAPHEWRCLASCPGVWSQDPANHGPRNADAASRCSRQRRRCSGWQRSGHELDHHQLRGGTTRLFPVPFAPGTHEGTDPALSGAGQLTLAENARAARNGRLAKRPHVSLVHSGGSTYRPVQFVDRVGSTNLVAAESELFVSDGTALHSAGTLPCGTPMGMRDYQHTGETAEDTPEVRVLAVSSVPMGDEVVVAYEYQTGDGFGLRTRTMTRVFHRESGRMRAQSTSLAVSEEQPMLMEVPGQGVRLFYRHRAGEVPGNGVFSAPIQASGSAARGSPLAGVVDTTEFVDTYSVATHPSLTSYYFIATCSSSGLGLRLWRVNAANNAPLDSVLVTAGTTSVAAVDICVSPTRVWVVWKDGNAVRARVYSHDFTTFASPNNQINTVDETAPFQPFVSYRESDGMAV